MQIRITFVEGVAGATSKELRVSDGRETVSAPGTESEANAIRGNLLRFPLLSTG